MVWSAVREIWYGRETDKARGEAECLDLRPYPSAVSRGTARTGRAISNFINAWVNSGAIQLVKPKAFISQFNVKLIPLLSKLCN